MRKDANAERGISYSAHDFFHNMRNDAKALHDGLHGSAATTHWDANEMRERANLMREDTKALSELSYAARWSANARRERAAGARKLARNVRELLELNQTSRAYEVF